jgi:hypothetical protein
MLLLLGIFKDGQDGHFLTIGHLHGWVAIFGRALTSLTSPTERFFRATPPPRSATPCGPIPRRARGSSPDWGIMGLALKSLVFRVRA